jgi:hypothetical protein
MMLDAATSVASSDNKYGDFTAPFIAIAPRLERYLSETAPAWTSRGAGRTGLYGGLQYGGVTKNGAVPQ